MFEKGKSEDEIIKKIASTYEINATQAAESLKNLQIYVSSLDF